ncbi:hypothetical protein [Brenneria tiliae]|uniref:hypothetical protein n=1 Tax=Brenneria tiliae TaxID=2914984 RepID=UPI002014D016|nr:hypothetical protein [Brenneria tiliae]MCL2898716.1 hypothetical protein [Brenneria tiliae]MCL2903347.1 hypothetical protein [Brenneria tiliae]
MFIDGVKMCRAHASSASVVATALTLLVFLIVISIRSSLLIPLGGVAAVGYLLLTMPYWWSKSNARSGVVILLACAVVLIWHRHSPDVSAVLVRFADVFWLLLGMGLLRHVMNEWHIPEQLSQWLIRRGAGSLTLSIAILTAFLAWPMSLGAIPLMIML